MQYGKLQYIGPTEAYTVDYKTILYTGNYSAIQYGKLQCDTVATVNYKAITLLYKQSNEPYFPYITKSNTNYNLVFSYSGWT